MSQQRLRSQSVDPSSHRHAAPSAFAPSSWERSSPFQPYGSPSQIRRQPGLSQQDYYKRQQREDYDMEEQVRPADSQPDPRRFHPAGLPYRHDMSSQDHRGWLQSCELRMINGALNSSVMKAQTLEPPVDGGSPYINCPVFNLAGAS